MNQKVDIMATLKNTSEPAREKPSKVMWLSLDAGLARLEECGIKMTKRNLVRIGAEGNAFLYGKNANAPMRGFPIHNITFEQWIAGSGGIRQGNKRKRNKKDRKIEEVAAP